MNFNQALLEAISRVLALHGGITDMQLYGLHSKETRKVGNCEFKLLGETNSDLILLNEDRKSISIWNSNGVEDKRDIIRYE